MGYVRTLALIVPALCVVACGAEGSLVIDASAVSEARAIELSVFGVVESGEAATLCEGLRSGAIGVDDGRLRLLRELAFHVDEAAPEIGSVPAGETIFLAVARADAPGCPAVGSGCVARDLVERQSVDVDIVVEPAASPLPCPSDRACVAAECRDCASDFECDDALVCTDDDCAAGRCVHEAIAGCAPCEGAGDCDDGDPCTQDDCVARQCTHSPAADVDRDGDGQALDLCGGDDCDDGDASTYLGAPRQCGEAIDHDCDGRIDDDQGCTPCEPTSAAAFVHLGTIDVDARRGLTAIGATEPSRADPVVLYALSATDLRAFSVDPAGVATELGSITHGANDPLAPLVVGDRLLLVERNTPYRLLVFSRAALEAGEPAAQTILENPPWGRPYSALVTGSELRLTANPDSLWSMNVAQIDALEPPASPLLEGDDYWDNCADMLLADGYLLCLTPLSGVGKLSVAQLADPGVTPYRQFSLLLAEAYDFELFPDLGDTDWIGLAQRDEGLVYVGVADLERDASTWSREFQEDLDRSLFPAQDCHETTGCVLAMEVSAFGPSAAVVMTRDGTSPGRLQLFLVDLTAPTVPRARPTIDVSLHAVSLGTEEHLFVSGSLVFVANAPPESPPGVEVYEVDCDGP
jgi:hypothetical protein